MKHKYFLFSIIILMDLSFFSSGEIGPSYCLADTESNAVVKAKDLVYKPIDITLFHDSIKHWQMKDGRGRNDQRYRTDQVVHIAENLLKFQNRDGGWPANLDWLAKIDPQEIYKIRNNSFGKSTFDNRTTYPQIDYLAKVYKITKLKRYRISALRGIKFLLKEQRSSGGWTGKDVDAVTFNDDVMVGNMNLLLKIHNGDPNYDWLDSGLSHRLDQSLDKAIKTTLKCQIVVNGKKTAWCQQHSHLNFKPVGARTYELPSITPHESTGVVLFLMKIPEPSHEIINSIESAVTWIKKSQLKGLSLKSIPIKPVKYEAHTAKYDIVVVPDRNAPTLWARFYEIQTNRPFFCNRDGIKVYRLDDVKLERRSGYGWYGTWPQEMLENNYPEWKRRLKNSI